MFMRNGELIGKKFVQYLLSTILMSMALSLGTIVDGIMASNFLGTDALGAINTCQPIILIFGAIYSIFGAGGSTLAATALGSGNKKKADQYFTMAISLLVLFGLLVVVIGTGFMNQMIALTTSGSSLGGLAKDYLSVFVFGAVLFFVVPGFSFFIRTDGRPTLAAIVLVVANVVNLICDAVYMKVFDMGVRGAALATLTGYFVGLFVTVPYITSKSRSLHFDFKSLSFSAFTEIFVCGLPNAFNSVLMTVKMLVLNRTAIDILGDNGASAVAICNNCLSFASIFIGGSAQTMLPIIGVLYGENDRKGMIAAVKKALQVVIGAGILMIIVFEIFPHQVALLFNVQTDELMNIAIMAIRLFGLSLPFFAVVYVFISFYQASAKRGFAIAITLCEGLVFIVPLILVLSRLLTKNGIGIWLTFVINEVCVLLMIFIVGNIIKSKTNKDNILLLDSEIQKSLDISIKAEINNATALSEKVCTFCEENGVDKSRANAAGLAVEEMTVNIITYGYKMKKDENIDIIVRINGDEIIIRIRDNGIPFNPFEYIPDKDMKEIESNIGGIAILKKIARSAEYSRALGFNNLIIKV